MKTLAILGCGDLGQQIAHYAIKDHHYNKVVFYDDFTKEKEINGYSILGNSDEVLLGYNNHLFDEIILAIGYKHLNRKKEIYNSLAENNIPFGKIIHSSS